MKEYGGEFGEGLSSIRAAYPVMKYKSGNDEKFAQIPFSSDIKFNALIRDANPSETNPTSEEDNITVYLKGAPDKVITRCTNVLVDGKVVPIDKNVRQRFELANEKFANNGERVLGFASIHLNPEHFTKKPAY